MYEKQVGKQNQSPNSILRMDHFKRKTILIALGPQKKSLGSMNSQSISEACCKIRVIHQILRIQRV